MGERHGAFLAKTTTLKSLFLTAALGEAVVWVRQPFEFHIMGLLFILHWGHSQRAPTLGKQCGLILGLGI